MFIKTLLLGLFVTVVVPATPRKNPILVLTDANFNATVTEDGIPTLVLFYAPWCPYSRAALPEYDRAARNLTRRQADLVLRVAKVDVTAERSLSRSFTVKYVPDMRLYRNGTAEESRYEGEFTKKRIVSWVEEQLVEM